MTAVTKSSSNALPAATVTLTVVMTAALTLNLIRSRMDAVLPPAAGVSEVAAALVSLPFWIPALVPINLIVALWAAAGVFEAQRRKKNADQAMWGGLKNIGGAFISAGLTGWLVVPLLTALDAGSLGGLSFPLGTTDAAIGMIGVALTLIAARSQRLKAELEQFV